MVSPQIPGRMRATVTLIVLSLIALSAPGSALAQSSSPQQTITVIGYGQASASAETALIEMVVGREDYGAPRAPNPNVIPGAEELEAVSPVVASLEAAQVPVDDIEVVISPTISNFYGPGGRGVARIEVHLDAPTQERIVELIDTAIVGAAENGLVLSLIGVGYGVSDCTTLEREAREAALSDAWSRGEVQADLMGLVLGDPVGASDVPVNNSDAFNAYLGAYTPTQSACAPPVPPLSSGSPLSTPPFDPTATAEVSVYAQVSIVFDASSDGDATPEA